MSPDLKSASARVRAPWLLLPWIAARGDAVFVQLFRQVVGAVLGAGKDQHLLPVALADHLREQFPLALFIDKVHLLRHLLGGGVAARHFHFQRVVQQLFRQRLDLVGEGRGEQQVLTLGAAVLPARGECRG